MTDAPDTDARSDPETRSFGFRDVPRHEKASLVRGVFDSVADRYDVMNDLMSGGLHRVWKDMTITRANPQPGERLIDVAGGTGDLAARWVERGRAAARRRGIVDTPSPATVIDINELMVRAGLTRAIEGVTWAVGDAERLPVPSRSADAVTIAFGIRNVTNRAAALGEFHRVLKPGGRVLILEFSRPTTAALQAVYDAWSFHAIPAIGAAVVNDRSSYEYLVESIRRFPHQSAFAAEVEAAGFSRVSVTNFAGGVAALHTGWRV